MDVKDQTNYLKSLFDKAATFIKNADFEISQSDQLFFYGCFKQVKDGPCSTPKPGLFDLQGKKKWDAWNNVKDLSKEEAMIQYINKLNQLYPLWESCSFTDKAWVSVSTLNIKEKSISDSEKTVFDFIKENNLEKIKLLPVHDLNKVDESQMSLLHWACDRGHSEIVDYLLRNGCNINIQDSEGQTPLHFAASCGHHDVVKLLLDYNAEICIRDNEGLIAIDCVDDENVKKLMDLYKNQN